jgi:histidyl-tRNA synthetase
VAKIQTLKGFRDILPEEALKRGRALALVKSVFKSYGFVPIETPTLEYAELVEKKVGEELQKLIFKFQDQGRRWVALRAEHTPSLARFVAENYEKLAFPFKRYQIGSIFRAEKPQAGRYRESTQVDFDTVGVDSALADAEIIAVATTFLELLRVKNFLIRINDRAFFNGLPPKAITIIDKADKIGEKGVKQELKKEKLDPNLLDDLKSRSPTPRLEEIFKYLKGFGVSERNFAFDPTLARGMDYYTGPIFEIVIGDGKQSIAGGGRYDNLIGTYVGRDVPAVGMAFGLDRLVESVPKESLTDVPFCPEVLVTIFSEDLAEKSIKIFNTIQGQGIDAEIYPDPAVKLDKQLKYADKKGIDYAVIIGPEEVKEEKVTIKDLRKGRQETVPLAALSAVLKRE